MRPQKINDDELIKSIFQSIRSKGYDGVSIRDLEQCSGLKKASLYHRFPNGKIEMTQKVITYVRTWLDQNVLSVLKDQNRAVEERLAKTLESIRLFYNNGEYTCLFKALSLENSYSIFEKELEQGMNHWLTAWEIFGKDKGFSPDVSKEKALQVMIKIQGALTVAKVMKKNEIFIQALKEIAQLYD
ncbi:TetR/AcrR family transcriptional regulator [Flammeovirga sp. EKP202]|uniref:TetR/AcrR family transcriptional regulator n=1 Tax=Flammeovirga sp. EKP202 TaxID=2770592 RepID=UPI00165F77C7|nr:TetR/AcrR family transcriptional regulator [Flammeovirga sp. EKP202]MBD0404265.1 TetR/AcrR family transcriptional regulator [Flammeovirga sp. EKP202]